MCNIILTYIHQNICQHFYIIISLSKHIHLQFDEIFFSNTIPIIITQNAYILIGISTCQFSPFYKIILT